MEHPDAPLNRGIQGKRAPSKSCGGIEMASIVSVFGTAWNAYRDLEAFYGNQLFQSPGHGRVRSER